MWRSRGYRGNGMGRSKVRRVRITTRWGHRIMNVWMMMNPWDSQLSEACWSLMWGDGNSEFTHISINYTGALKLKKCEGLKAWWCLTLLDSLLVLRLCCMDSDSAMSVTGLWIFFRSPLYFTCRRSKHWEVISIWAIAYKKTNRAKGIILLYIFFFIGINFIRMENKIK